MERSQKFELHQANHMSITSEDLLGNRGLGRYIILPGSPGRAQKIAELFENQFQRPHPRGHHFYGGDWSFKDKKIDVGVVATGMGGPSAEIIVSELLALGAKQMIRVGTCGSLQPDKVQGGDMVCVTGCVKDESTSKQYVPVEIPAMASLGFLAAAQNIKSTQKLHFGLCHTKDSLYGREFGMGPYAKRNTEYMDLLSQCGVLASEMEASVLYTLCQLHQHAGWKKNDPVPFNWGCFLAVIGDTSGFAGSPQTDAAIQGSIQAALEVFVHMNGIH